MASTYKTPGVYVEEITKFPPSVAAVETAIPAFIGYTEFAEKNGESLKNIPTSIESFLEFEQFFGGPPPRNIIVRLSSANQYLRTERQGTPYLLYDSVRLFYDNGGGICYIVSVDDYTKVPAIGNDTSGILGGLRTLEKYDEPTLIVSPDSVSLSSDLYTFQQQAIAQCNKLQDRFLICDLLKNDENAPNQTFVDRVNDFRNNIGINYLKYGAAYTPWLRTSLPSGLRFRDIIFAVDGDPAPTSVTSLALLSSLTTAGNLLQLIFDLSNGIAAVDLINSKIKPGGAGSLVDTGVEDLDSQLKKLLKGYLAVYNDPTKIAFADYSGTATGVLTVIYAKIRDILQAITVIHASLPTVVPPPLLAPSPTQSVEFKLKTDIDKNRPAYDAVLSTLATHHFEHGVKITPPGAANLLMAGSNLTDVLNFPPPFASLAVIPKDKAVQALYRTQSAKTPTMAILKTIAAAPAGTAPGLAVNAITLAIPAPADLKANLEAAIAAEMAAAATPLTLNDTAAALKTQIGLDIAAASDKNKLLFTIITAFIDDEVALVPLVKIGEAFPSGAFPTAVSNSLNQFLLDAKNIAVNAAGLPGATKTSVANALVFTFNAAKEYTLIAASAANTAGAAAISLFNTILNSASSYESIFDQSLFQNFGIYKTLLTKAGQDLMILPPGAAIAGVYASVDSNRGVWKAPANASLASVLGPFFLISAQDQESLNVDTNSGKSINAIRAFTGRGTLVWGTRTLAGNDNEWRYVPVRRFFNYAEESIKKATEPFVFEPNDLNTWVRVKAMIENFLTLEWRRGALAGAKATDAFYVKVGLGETMTALDILEGRMIIEIGLAVVRPAEFIILRFSHKMQES
ncbi:MAG TPA: phage tail sheath C-terminal domain-containing protein [Chitinophagaceae bacterium]